MYKILLLIFFSITFSQFQWQDGGLPLRQGVHIEWQRTGAVSEDGSVIIAWSDTRNSIRDIYVQKIDSNGNYLWDSQGLSVIDYDGRQEDPLLVTDGAGGAYIIWRDYRDENYYGDIYGQHIDQNGNKLWDSDGVPLSNQTGEQSSHNLCIDGNGGAFAVWVDKNGSGSYIGTHLTNDQEDISSIGEGILISTHQNGGFSLESAGNGEAVMVWTDLIEDNEIDLRAQRFDSEMNSLWNENNEQKGRIIVDEANIQHKAKVTTFNDNRVVVVWRDLRNDPDGDIYAQILNDEGESILNPNGIIVCNDDGQQASPRVKSDSTHAFIYWEDKRYNNVDPFVQKMDVDGNLIWMNNGVQISSNDFDQDQVRMSVDHNGGAFFSWVDGRGSENEIWAGSDIYAGHIDQNGSVLEMVIDEDSGPQKDPLIKCNNNGEAYIVWNDQKDGSNIGIEIEKITTNGTSFENNGQEVWYGVDGNALLSSSLQLSNGEFLVAWEDNRYLSSGHPGSFTYGLKVTENININSHESSTPLSLNPYQGPHGGNYSFRAKLAMINNSSIMMNFHQYDGPYRQYTQILNDNLDILGNDYGDEVSSSGQDQKYSALSSIGENYFLAYSENDNYFIYSMYLQKFNIQGDELWDTPINLIDGSGGITDYLVRTIIPNELNNGIVVVYESTSFMGLNLEIIFVDNDGQIMNQYQVCNNCENPQFESYAIGDNEFIITYKSASSNLAAGVFSQIFSFDGNILGGENGLVISDEINDQRSSDITYNSTLDEYLICWNDGRNTFINEDGDEVADLDVYCSTVTFEDGILSLNEIPIAAISGSQQQNPSIFTSHDGIYMIAWEDMRSAAGIDQSLNLSFEWDAYYQEINMDGAVYPDGGISLSTAPFGQVNMEFGTLSEEENLYLIFWEDDRSTGKELLTNIYAQLVSPTASADCNIYDVNNDNNIDVLDIVLMVNIVLGLTTPDTWQECAADINSDGSIDVLDVVQTVGYILNP